MKKFVMKPSARQEIPVNPVWKLLRTLAILIYVVGFCYGAMWLSQHGTWDGAVSAWFSAFLLGSVVLGLAEIVRLLHRLCCREYEGDWQEIQKVSEAEETAEESADS